MSEWIKAQETSPTAPGLYVVAFVDLPDWCVDAGPVVVEYKESDIEKFRDGVLVFSHDVRCYGPLPALDGIRMPSLPIRLKYGSVDNE